MTSVALTGGAYTARSVIAAAQRCLNLFPESIPTGNKYTGSSGQDEPRTHAHYPTPGLRLLGVLPKGPVRGIHQATTGGIYAVGGDTLYSVNPAGWTATVIGTITPGLKTPVSMKDNGLDLAIVDGTSTGWRVTLSNNAFATIGGVADDPDGMFVGADRVEYLDTYFIFNKPGTPQFYWSGSLALTFDSLDFANKSSYSDLVVTIAVARREIYLIGTRTTEIFYDIGQSGTDQAGFASSQFQSRADVFIDHGCAAKYSPAYYDNAIMWLTQDRQGRGFVMQTSQYKTYRVSTYAIEAEFATYPRIDDAIGFFYQLGGHTFYVLTFPHADKTWCFDMLTNLWHEWHWIDTNGDEHRHRANCFCPCANELVVGDWQNGNLYALDSTVFTDNGAPIKRLRAYPHMLADGKRVFYRQFLADMETGTAPGMLEGVAATRIDCTFTAADGTALQDYANAADVGSVWTPVAGSAQILADRMVGTGSALYQASGSPLFPDYSLRFAVVPPAYDSVLSGTSLFAIARSLGANTGYRAQVSADGTQYTLQVAALGTAVAVTVAMGTLTSGRYTVWLTMRGESIVAQVQRSQDALWLRQDALWLTDPATVAAAFAERTYTAPGVVMIGGVWP
jgi:hypothetical protein